MIGAEFSHKNFPGAFCGLFAGISFAIYLWCLKYICNYRFTQLFIIGLSSVIAFMVSFAHIENWYSIFAWHNVLFGLVTSLMGQIITFELLTFAGNRLNSTILGSLTTTELPTAMLLSWSIWVPRPSALQAAGLCEMILAIVWMKVEDDSERKKPFKIGVKLCEGQEINSI